MKPTLTMKLAQLQAEQYETARYLAKQQISPQIVDKMRWTRRLKLTRALAPILGVVAANAVIQLARDRYAASVEKAVARRLGQLQSRGLQVVAIAGSYGKTSVKNYLYDVLRTKMRVVATPESYNTVLGIAKCLEYEVDEKTQVFIVEMGAYHIGDIRRLMEMAHPSYGILTGIARQHLERFGSFENIKKAKGEIAEYLGKHGGKLVANWSDSNVVDVVTRVGVSATQYQGPCTHEINLEGAKAMAMLLGMSKKEVDRVVVRPVKNRLEMTDNRYGMKVLDNSFSSNDKSFGMDLERLGKEKKYTRILVTSGLVELGSDSEQIHEMLGQQVLGKADIVILVGKNERTEALARGIGKDVPLLHIDKTLQFVKVVKELKLKKEPLVLIENDVPENY